MTVEQALPSREQRRVPKRHLFADALATLRAMHPLVVFAEARPELSCIDGQLNTGQAMRVVIKLPGVQVTDAVLQDLRLRAVNNGVAIVAHSVEQMKLLLRKLAR